MENSEAIISIVDAVSKNQLDSLVVSEAKQHLKDEKAKKFLEEALVL